MNIGGGEAADQLVRMMLSGSEVAVRLSGSAIKNMLALTMALAKNHKTISGKVNLVKMLKETRDVRRFSMSPEQYQQFRQRAGKQKILFSAIRDSDNKGKVVDVIMPVTEIDRANMIFERIRYTGQPEQVHCRQIKAQLLCVLHEQIRCSCVQQDVFFTILNINAQAPFSRKDSVSPVVHDYCSFHTLTSYNSWIYSIQYTL